MAESPRPAIRAEIVLACADPGASNAPDQWRRRSFIRLSAFRAIATPCRRGCGGGRAGRCVHAGTPSTPPSAGESRPARSTTARSVPAIRVADGRVGRAPPSTWPLIASAGGMLAMSARPMGFLGKHRKAETDRSQHRL